MSDDKIKKNPGVSINAPAGMQEVVITQTFDAPRDLVFKTYNDPVLRSKWWGPKELETNVEMMDVKPGGAWRIIQCDAGGKEFAFHGLYHTVKDPESIVMTFEFEGMPGHVSLESLNFEELQGGKTCVTDTVVFQSVEDRDGMIQTGMERGIYDSYERISELLEKLCYRQSSKAA